MHCPCWKGNLSSKKADKVSSRVPCKWRTCDTVPYRVPCKLENGTLNHEYITTFGALVLRHMQEVPFMFFAPVHHWSQMLFSLLPLSVLQESKTGKNLNEAQLWASIQHWSLIAPHIHIFLSTMRYHLAGPEQLATLAVTEVKPELFDIENNKMIENYLVR